MYLSPRPLTREDDFTAFSSNSVEQTAWLVNHARQAHAARSAYVMVVTPERSREVVAYYAWSMASVGTAQLPDRAARGVGHLAQPFALLARLAVDSRHEGRGLGHALLADVVSRTVAVADSIGCRGLLVHCESSAARAFYLHALPEFEALPIDALHLTVLTKDIRRALGG